MLEGTTSDAAHSIRYVKKRRQHEDKGHEEEARFVEPPTNAPTVTPAESVAARRKARTASRRVFHLQDTLSRVAGSRKGNERRVATFVEKKRKKVKKRSRHERKDGEGDGRVTETKVAQPVSADIGHAPTSASVETYKRPGKGSALRSGRKGPVTSSREETPEERKTKQELAEYMARAAVEVTAGEMEVEKEGSVPKARNSRLPKLSPSRARELHEQRIITNGSLAAPSQEIDMESADDTDDDDDNEDDFEIDTYILAPPNPPSSTPDVASPSAEVGYLVIAPADLSLWQTYLDDPSADEKEFASDDEDENAEDFYGADYPEDEVETDDEFDRNPYGYRGVDEEWGLDEASWSEDEYERMTDPFRKFKIGSGAVRVGGGGENSD